MPDHDYCPNCCTFTVERSFCTKCGSTFGSPGCRLTRQPRHRFSATDLPTVKELEPCKMGYTLRDSGWDKAYKNAERRNGFFGTLKMRGA